MDYARSPLPERVERASASPKTLIDYPHRRPERQRPAAQDDRHKHEHDHQDPRGCIRTSGHPTIVPSMRNPAHRPEGQAIMPFSDGQGKDVALGWYQKIAPKTVVDIGAGAGTYARLMRPAHPAHWTAIEAWEPYAARFDLVDHYDDICIADARDLGSPAFAVDLVIAGDVLEHMTHAEARGLLARVKQTAANVIVSIPVLHLDQDDVFGNPYERHIDHWTADAMRNELSPGVVAEWVGNVLAYFWWRQA